MGMKYVKIILKKNKLNLLKDYKYIIYIYVQCK